MTVYQITNWNNLFENNRTRELKKMEWVPVPNKHDGDGFTDLMGRQNGVALFGAWVLILQVASKCDPRGILVRQNPAPLCGELPKAHTAASIARITRCPEGVVQGALDACCEIGWIEYKSYEPKEVIEKTEEIPQVDAGECLRARRREGNGIEKNGTEKTSSPICIDDSEDQFVLGPTRSSGGKKRPKHVWYEEGHDLWYQSFWNKKGKTNSRTAYEKRVNLLVDLHGLNYSQARIFLSQKVGEDRARFEHTTDWTWRANLHPATWLNKERWTDEPPTVAAFKAAKETRESTSDLVRRVSEGGK